MNFGTVLFGFAPHEVERHIAMLEQLLCDRKKEIQKLEHTVHMLEFEKEDLEQRLLIANEINQYRKTQAQVSE